jgi:isohexenylglutaconyl-CoA hydratase
VLNEVLQCAPAAVAATKGLLRKARFTPPADLVQEAAQLFADAATGTEGIEGASAFVQKRKPRWAP